MSDPTSWVIYELDPPKKSGGSFMHARFVIDFDGSQDELYAQLPPHPDGRSAEQTWYPQMRAQAERVTLECLRSAASELLRSRTR